MSAEQVNDRLGIGVNLGNALEGPREGVWGLTLEEGFFSTIAEAGFGHVRLPVRFSAYADESAPFLIPDGIDPTVPNADNLWERIDWVIANAEQNGLYVIIDLHHYDELFDDVAGNTERYLAIWEQIAERYQNASSLVLFEVLNEPHGQFNEDPDLLNDLLDDVMGVVRASNPTRPTLVGPVFWNSIDALDDLELPADPNLIVSVHFYEPFSFTHQGATWLDTVPPPANFEADLVGFGAGWQNWSWRSALTTDVGGLTQSYEDQWAGLGFGRPGNLLDPASMTVTVSGAAELSVRCAAESDPDELIELGRIESVASPTDFVIDMTSCPSDTQLVAFMLASETPATVLFSSVEVCESTGTCTRPIESAGQAIESAMAEAAAWGVENDRPINVGEFGAYSAEGEADLGERVEWTSTVRNAGVSQGFSMTYWEFGAGFGVYDPVAGEWVEPLLTALAVEPVVQEPFVRGDANCDGRVTVTDALYASQFVVGNRQPSPSGCPLGDPQTQLSLERADINGVGGVTVLDSILIAQCSVGLDIAFCPS